MYKLTFGFYNTTGLTHTAKYLGIDNTPINDVPVVAWFERNGYYGYTLAIADAFQGFVLFKDNQGGEPAIFGINPQEVENTDVKTSTVRSTGIGNTPYTVTVLSQQNQPIADVSVWITSDQVGLYFIAGIAQTPVNGAITFLLNPGNYYLWRRHNTYTFVNPQEITV